MIGPLIALLAAVVCVILGYSRHRKAKKEPTTFTGSDTAPSIEKKGGKRESDLSDKSDTQPSWLRKRTDSLGSNIDKILKDNWRRDGLVFLIVFSLAHLLSYYYFPTWYRLLLLDNTKLGWAIWVLQVLLILWALVSVEVKKHKLISVFTRIAIGAAALATLDHTGFALYNHFADPVKAESERVAQVESSQRQASLASVDSAVFVPPINRTCTQKENPLDTIFTVPVDTLHGRNTIIVPEHCKIETAKTDNPRLIYIEDTKEYLTDLKTRTNIIVPGQFVSIPDSRVVILRGYRAPGVIQVHIFPMHKS
jgi:hypothetical protein